MPTVVTCRVQNPTWTTLSRVYKRLYINDQHLTFSCSGLFLRDFEMSRISSWLNFRHLILFLCVLDWTHWISAIDVLVVTVGNAEAGLAEETADEAALERLDEVGLARATVSEEFHFDPVYAYLVREKLTDVLHVFVLVIIKRWWWRRRWGDDDKGDNDVPITMMMRRSRKIRMEIICPY